MTFHERGVCRRSAVYISDQFLPETRRESADLPACAFSTYVGGCLSTQTSVAMLAADPGLAQLERMASARLQPRAPSAPVMQGLGFSTDFTCRGRAMHNLTAEQARLAHSGRIGARLRRNSPVYYWQTTPQRRSRHEALCQKGSRWHLTTFGSHGKFEEKAKAKCASVGRLKHRVVHPRHIYAKRPPNARLIHAPALALVPALPWPSAPPWRTRAGRLLSLTLSLTLPRSIPAQRSRWRICPRSGCGSTASSWARAASASGGGKPTPSCSGSPLWPTARC